MALLVTVVFFRASLTLQFSLGQNHVPFWLLLFLQMATVGWAESGPPSEGREGTSTLSACPIPSHILSPQDRGPKRYIPPGTKCGPLDVHDQEA